MDPIEIEDDGYVEVSIGGARQKLDLYDAFNELRDISTATKDDPAAFAPRVQQFLEGRGFPGVSQRAAARVADAVYARVESLRGNDRGPGSLNSASGPDSGAATSAPPTASESSSPPTGSKRKKS